jgi:hypothetical protein
MDGPVARPYGFASKTEASREVVMGKHITIVLVTVLALCGMLRGAAEAALI